MLGIGLRAWLATVMAIACVVSPPFLYFENYLFYEYPTLLLLCAAAVALHRFLATGRAPAGVVAFALMATVVLTRSLFQIVWLVCVVVAVAACCRVDTQAHRASPWRRASWCWRCTSKTWSSSGRLPPAVGSA
jgi:hypothetical protein